MAKTLEMRSRPPLERMLRIHHALQSGNYPNATTLAAELEVSEKSIQRDLDFMRDRMQLPIEYDGSRFGYYYTQEVGSFPTVQISEGELFALLVAEKALQQYRGTTFERPLISAFKKIADSLPDTVSLNLAEWEQTISFRTRAEPILNLEIFDTLARATSGQQQLEITYRKPGQGKPETRLVDPYHLANINGEWFLFAFDHLRNDIRTFVPARIRNARPTGKKFKRPEKFSVEKTLRGSFGVHSGKGRHDVVIHFDATVADYIREKRWHPSQKLRPLPRGGVALHMQISSLSEVERWVLSWSGHAMPVAPSELVAGVKRAAQQTLQQFPRGSRRQNIPRQSR
jgi:predicted DNA-binding transcriptional regulator YafY